MTTVFRTPEERFNALPQYPFQPRYLEVPAAEGQPLRMHYVDEGDPGAPVMLLLHGMPTWSFLYRRMIPGLVEAGYRCVAPDHIGFGKSDKVLEDEWYSIEKHSQNLRYLVRTLDLRRMTLVCQDWGGPIGLRQVVDMPERFERLAILNTWLHHEGYEYSPAIRAWNAAWHPGGAMDGLQGCGFVMQNYLANFPKGSTPLTPEGAFAAYEAPFPDRASKAGPRRFPLSIPFDNPEGGNIAEQERCFEALRSWTKPIHFIWGERDQVFTETWGRAWAAMYPQATYHGLDAGHFLQESHGPEIAEILLGRIAEE
ncbi:MAG: haloalkane dehalogenase [Dehalococcoidia bacterium]|nr:haloalkane dehalogenase [Dehalococcoidia bacterium]